MNPLELEMYHQIKNVIGVNPSFYEYLFMVDADTTVHELSLNRLVSAMMHDKKIIGVCGETSIANAKQSIVTMSQVYEYFITTSPKLSSRCLAVSLVFPVVFPCTASERPTRTNHYSFPTRSSMIIAKTGSIRCI